MADDREPPVNWGGYAPSPALVTVMCASLLAFGIVYFDVGSGSRDSISLVKALIWPILLVAGVLSFRPQVEQLIGRIASVKVAGVDIKIDPARIPIPEASGPVTLDNVALLHTSFLRPDITASYDDGRTYYQIEVVVIAPEETLRRIEMVKYYLDKKAYPTSVYKIKDRKSRFKLKELANGTSIVRAELTLRDQDPIHLNRFIDLRPTGPRI